MSVNIVELEKFLAEYLNIHDFADYGPNGLQIQGKTEVKKIAFAVSATQESIQQAIQEKADCLIVHHGLFWKFHGVRTITGPFSKRVKPLIKNDINLLGYHLPLDAHPEIGNAASIAKRIGLEILGPFGDHKGSATGIYGKLNPPLLAVELKDKLAAVLNHEVLHSSPDDNQKISTIGIITGGANGDWHHSLNLGLDAYLTGEMSEHDWHEAKESEIHMFAGGHNATEQFGVQELQEVLVNKYDIESVFISSDNPA